MKRTKIYRISQFLSIVFLGGFIYPSILQADDELPITQDKNGKTIYLSEVRKDWNKWRASYSLARNLESNESLPVYKLLGDLALASQDMGQLVYMDSSNAISILGRKCDEKSNEILSKVAIQTYPHLTVTQGDQLNAEAARDHHDCSKTHRSLAYNVLQQKASKGIVLCPFGRLERKRARVPREAKNVLRTWFSSQDKHLKTEAAVCMAQVGLDNQKTFEFAILELKAISNSSNSTPTDSQSLHAILSYLSQNGFQAATNYLEGR